MDYHKGALMICPADHPYRATSLSNCASSHRASYLQQGHIEDLEKAVECHKEALLRYSSEHPGRFATLINLGLCLTNRFEKLGDVEDLEVAIQSQKEALLLCPPSHPFISASLNNLAMALALQFHSQGCVSKLEEAMHYHEEALELRPIGHPHRAASLHNLAECFFNLYKKQGGLERLRKALELQKEALSLCPPGHPDRLMCLNGVGNCLQMRYRKDGNVEDLIVALGYYKEALDRKDNMSLNNLASCLLGLYEVNGDVESLSQAIQYYQDALALCPLGHPDRSSALINVGESLRIRSDHQGNSGDLKIALKYHREALNLCPKGHPNRSAALGNLSILLLSSFDQNGSSELLEEAMECHREALALQPLGHPDRPTTLHNLASCLYLSYRQRYLVQYLEEAIQLDREAVTLAPPGHPIHIASLSGLGSHLQTRYEEQLYIENLTEAIERHRAALSHCSTGFPDQPAILSSLGSCLFVLFRQHRNIQDLEEAVKCQRSAAQLCLPGSQYQSSILNNLALSLHRRYQELGAADHLKDLEEAIQINRHLLVLHSKDHAQYSSSLYNLSLNLAALFKHQGTFSILEEAVYCIETAIEVVPPNHASLTACQAQLALLYADHPELQAKIPDAKGWPELFEKALTNQTASLIERFQVALEWLKRQHGPQGLTAYQRCMELADMYLSVRPSVASRHKLLSQMPKALATEAAASAIEAGDLRKAVEFLEQGRTMLWSQMSRYRTPLDALKHVNPGLAAEFTYLSRQLEASATAHSALAWNNKESIQHEALIHSQTAASWSAVVAKIQLLDGFENFLQPPKFGMLQRGLLSGPIILVNISQQRCDAIVMQPTGDPVLVPLPELQHTYVQELSIQYTGTLVGLRRLAAGSEADSGKSARKRLCAILEALWENIVYLVVDQLQQIGIKKGSHIWWCPTSWLAMLPLHAAGIWHHRNKSSLADFYVSSYTPTLSALVRSFKNQQLFSSNCAIPPLVIIAQPKADGQDEIPNVKMEIQRIQEVVPVVKVLMHEQTAHDVVIAHLRQYPWAHFASHGSQDSTDPFNSCFHLYGRPLTLLDIIQAHLPDAQFAFISACHSATGDHTNPDEIIHLAAGLQFSGFRSVIGTMSAMADIDGPVVAEEVYKYMFRHIQKRKEEAEDVLVDYKDAAQALHIATKVLRESGVPLERWINFIHIGV
ncbi:hypothetical protein FRC02_003053 [Tulasnella sp. 418]|nr:hypothetical protein FRC02_003053 [Tulasnella sp. 418]